MWMVDSLDSRIHRRMFPNREQRGVFAHIHGRSEVIDTSWNIPEQACLRDRAGPVRLLMQWIKFGMKWGLMSMKMKSILQMADRLFRMGNDSKYWNV